MTEDVMTPHHDTAELPAVMAIGGHRPGPVVALLGGVHGDELEGVLAARRVAGLLDAVPLRGTLRVAAPAHPAAWAATSRTSPVDGQNLARVFPGSSDGSPTERVAAHLTDRLITGADVLIDLHSAGQGFDMPLMVGYRAGPDPVCARSAEIARVFGAPFLWQHPGSGQGRSLSAAAALGIPSIYVEGRGGGQVRRGDLDCYVDGVLRVLDHLGVIDDGPPAAAAPVVVHGDGNTDGGIEATVDGYLVTATEVGRHVHRGETLAELVDGDGATLAVVRSPRAGVVMLLRRPAKVAVGDTLAIVADRVEAAR